MTEVWLQNRRTFFLSLKILKTKVNAEDLLRPTVMFMPSFNYQRNSRFLVVFYLALEILLLEREAWNRQKTLSE